MSSEPIPPRRRRRLLRWGGVILLITMGFLAGTAARLAQAPVVLPGWVLERVEARVNRDLGPLSVTLERLALGYDVDAQALRLVLQDATLRRDGTELARLPVTRLGLDGPALIRGQMRPRSLVVEGVSLTLARDAQGRWSLALGPGGGAWPGSWSAALDLLDRTLGNPLMDQLQAVRIEGLDLELTDAVTGLAEKISADAVLQRTEDGADLTANAQLQRLGASLTASLTRDGGGARATIGAEGVRIGALAAALPALPALTLARGTVAAEARFSLDAEGVPGPLEGTVTMRDVTSTDRPDLAADRVLLSVSWTPGTEQVRIDDLAASSDVAALGARGQVLLRAGLTGPMEVQLRLRELRLDPDGMFDRAASFDDGVLEARLTQVPLALEVGQAMLSGPSGLARAQGTLRFPESGIDGDLALTIPEIAVDDLKALWPRDLTPGSRRWFMRNLLGGVARDVTAALRLRPGEEPELAASLTFDDGAFRYMRFMPPATDARGAMTFNKGRATIRADAGVVNVGEGPGIDIAGTRLVLPDALSRPPEGQLDLRATGAIGDVLELLDNRPITLLQRLRKTRELASGQAEARVSVVLPLRPGNAPADISWDVQTTLTGVQSDLIVPNRRIEAERLTLRASPTSVEIGGPLRFDGVPFDGVWSQALPPPSTEAIDPDAPPPPPRPLPGPGRLRGIASATPEGLAALGVRLDALNPSGRTDVVLDVTLPQGEPPRVLAQSDMRGMSLRLPALNWSKGAGTAGDLRVEAVLGPAPDVTALAFEAPGLTAMGAITLRDGALAEARFSEVRTPWFRGPVTLAGRGAGRPVAVRVGGGQADLRQALTALGSAGGSGTGGGAPLAIALDRLQVSDAIALTGLRAELQNGTGRFTGGVNGGQQVNGVLAPREGGTVVQVRTDDAGGVLRSTGLFRDARGGEMTLTLQTTLGGGPLRGTLRGTDLTVRDAPALASLLQTLSVVGLLEQLAGQGLPFTSVQADFTLQGGNIRLARGSAVGPSMSITADGVYDANTKQLDLQGVVSPIYFVNGLFGALFSRRDEGLFGFTYRLRGPAANPQVNVNPLSILTPGRFRDIFRAPPPSQ